MLEDIIIVDQLVKDFRVRFKINLCPGPVGIPNNFQLRGLFPPGKGLGENLLVLLNFNHQLHRQGVNHRNPNTVEPPGYLIPSAAKFPAGMKNGQGQFHPGFFLFMVHPCWNPTAIICHGDSIVRIHHHGNIPAIACQGLIDGVIHHLVYQMMESLLTRTSDVHPRAFSNCLQAF